MKIDGQLTYESVNVSTMLTIKKQQTISDLICLINTSVFAIPRCQITVSYIVHNNGGVK